MRAEPLVLEAASPEDVEGLVLLERQSFSHPWTARAFREAMKDRERGVILVLRNPAHAPDELEAGLRAYCVLEYVVDELHVHNLAVHPARRGQGLGRLLLKMALEYAGRRGARAAFLEVRRSNWAAQQLYRSVGFRAVSVRRDYYSHPTEDALVLRNDVAAPGPSGNP